MKNSKGETLPQPYYDLALMRRERQSGSDYRNRWDDKFEQTNSLNYAFSWGYTPEKYDWWDNVYEGKTPEIPASSLAELEAWRKSRDGNNQEAMVADNPEPDYKAMYDELCKRYKALDHNHNRLCQDYDFYKHRTNVIADPTTSRNWIAECSMGIMAETGECDTAWNRAEAWAAEGKKRWHI